MTSDLHAEEWVGVLSAANHVKKDVAGKEEMWELTGQVPAP